jgi:hypothetical protein
LQLPQLRAQDKSYKEMNQLNRKLSNRTLLSRSVLNEGIAQTVLRKRAALVSLFFAFFRAVQDTTDKSYNKE